MHNVHSMSFNQSNEKTLKLQEIQTASNSDHECAGLTQFPDCKELAPQAAAELQGTWLLVRRLCLVMCWLGHC